MRLFREQLYRVILFSDIQKILKFIYFTSNIQFEFNIGLWTW